MRRALLLWERFGFKQGNFPDWVPEEKYRASADILEGMPQRVNFVSDSQWKIVNDLAREVYAGLRPVLLRRALLGKNTETRKGRDGKEEVVAGEREVREYKRSKRITRPEQPAGVHPGAEDMGDHEGNLPPPHDQGHPWDLQPDEMAWRPRPGTPDKMPGYGPMATGGGAPKCQPCSTNKVYKPPKSSRKKSIKKKKSKKKTKKKYIKKSPKYSTKKSLKKKSFKKGSRKKTLRKKSKRKSKK
jgi:hypothetical protein